MVKLNENFVIDKGGNKIGVFIDMKSYQKMMLDLEELNDIRAYDAAKASGDDAIPFDKAIREIEQGRRKCATR
jgi:hypothetical protein